MIFYQLSDTEQLCSCAFAFICNLWRAQNVLIRCDGATLHLGFGGSIWYHRSLGRIMQLEKNEYSKGFLYFEYFNAFQFYASLIA